MTASQNQYSSISLIGDELARRGYTAEELCLPQRWTCFTKPDNQSFWLTPRAYVSYPFVSASAKQISLNKQQAYNFVAAQGVTIPKTLELPADSSLVAKFLEAYKPVIVKPKAGSGSGGVTLDITTADQLEQAIALATTYSSSSLLQEQVAGHEIRITVIEGEVVSAILRETARITGDGVSSVQTLIDNENELRAADNHTYLSYPALTGGMIPEAPENDQILEAGEIIELNKSSLVSGGASLYNVTDKLHDSYKVTVIRLANSLNPEFLVIDLMIQDITAPQTDSNYTFIEFNTAPALKMYYAVRDGKEYDIVAKLVDMIDHQGDKND